MRVLSAKVTNFGSYSNLEFQFDSLGLTLISGPTGAGKSTLLDIIPWCLFGTTAKNGAANDVLPWTSTEGTRVVVQLTGAAGAGRKELSGSDSPLRLSVVRTRGGKTGSNDLYWQEGDSDEKYRGKDLNDTQRLLEQRLGISADSYLASAYFHEFSSTGTFFTSSAKGRRELFDRVCDLSFPIRLSTASNDLRRGARAAADSISLEQSKIEGRLCELEQSSRRTAYSAEQWETCQKAKIQDLEAKAASFEADKASRVAAIESQALAWVFAQGKRENALEATVARLKQSVKDHEHSQLETAPCQSCGVMPASFYEDQLEHDRDTRDLARAEADLKRANKERNPYLNQLADAANSVNAYWGSLESEKAAHNPFRAQYEQSVKDLDTARIQLDVTKRTIATNDRRISALTRIIDLCGTLRGELLRKAVREIETQTNSYLEKHFDAVIRVGFTVTDSDDLEVSIHKSGYECNYRQLSRGQRAVLRLCFAVSVMRASANAAGVTPNAIAFDEVADGLDADMKLKAVGLFEHLALEYSTVMVIDHATEMKSAFNRTFEVELVGDTSQIQEAL